MLLSLIRACIVVLSESIHLQVRPTYWDVWVPENKPTGIVLNLKKYPVLLFECRNSICACVRHGCWWSRHTQFTTDIQYWEPNPQPYRCSFLYHQPKHRGNFHHTWGWVNHPKFFWKRCVFVRLCNNLCVLGAVSLRARTGVIYNRGETRGNVDVLKRKFDEFCSSRNEISFEDNPFFTCVQRAGATMAHADTHTHTIHAV